MAAPAWIQDAVFYQIFPDRFANGEPANDPPNVEPWGAPPTLWGFQGGDLRGVMQRFEYLLDLGVTALYFNPIFLSSSNHRYNTYDYFRIDPKLGTLEDFHALLNLAHRHGVRVLLDGVFNHCGRGFFAFADVLENGEHSPYRGWFHIHRFPVDAFSPGKAQDYEAWWGFKSLPKFNTATQAVREYIFSVARYWLEQGIDGWRLDVPNGIDDDAFWAEFRRIVKRVNPRAALIGEIW
ncbi:MAG TPA: alpha-amylase, partial [Chloroflexi bacterium]|nr:alpha-amylase [Chloroflexota bacterium]